MKYLSKFLLLSLVTTTFFACIKKAEDLPFFTNGKAVTVTSSKASIAATPNQADSVVWTLSWSSPAYATDTANMKYIIEIDSAGRNFA
ncbi:MAG: SusE domain-containing protein, partial [Ginsengibacter sp.]